MFNYNIKLMQFFKSFFLIFFISIIFIEFSLRAFTSIFPEPLKSFIEESRRITYSNIRGIPYVSILLPKVKNADVLVVGDSFPFGSYVHSEDTFPSILEKISNKKVINLGVGSQGIPEYNRMLEVGLRYAPSTVIYCIFVNDFYYSDLNSVRVTKLDNLNTYRDIEGDDRLFIKELSFYHKRLLIRKKITNQFISFQIYKKFQFYSSWFNFDSIKLPNINREEPLISVINDYTFFFSPISYWDSLVSYSNNDVYNGIIKNIELISEARRFAEENGIDFKVVLIPTKEMVYKDLVSDNELKERMYSDDHYKTYVYLSQALEEKGIVTLDLTPHLIHSAKEGKKLYFSIDGHFNEQGHIEVAETLKTHFF